MDVYWSKEADACDEFAQSAYEYYSVDTVAELLRPTGLLIDKSTQYVGSFEKYVFLNGNKNEIYTRPEIDFISEVNDIIVFTEFHKAARRGAIPCRVIAVKNTHWDPIGFSIAFTKIINKASDGFNICFVVSEEGCIFTCRAYDEITASNYYISDIIRTKTQMDELCDGLIYSPDYSGFIEYYSYVRESIKFDDEITDYVRNRNTQRTLYAYIESLQEVESATRVDFSREIERCFWGLEEQYQATYADRVAEAEEYLFKIEPAQINTMEMLFEAEEMEKLAAEAEQRNEIMLKQHDDKDDSEEESDWDEDMKAWLADPEALIKLLKKKRGI